ncbi:MAG: PDDEXK nuclease domain-containing protein [Bacteroidales bacterium]|jgi:predicted nuclease of restriction endonuclease-like (RecB) superfamily|nr:PDDEXK nuclease domain-containing protein [Bacteroidales bacterium]
MNFEKLVIRIKQTNDFLQQSAVKAVNTHLTFRNWLTGFYIVEFEQNGSDRAKYGTKLLETIAKNISIKGLTPPELSRCRQFYTAYPQILGLITQELKNVFPVDFLPENAEKSILGLPTQELQNEDLKHISTVFQNISYTHLTELIKIDDRTKRRFYELLILKTQPSVKELKRQIETLTFERVCLSENHKTSFDEVMTKIQPQQATDLVKSHYFFEFLNVGQPHLIEETELEQALVSHLQQFITELGNGFCFEARQKRILIGDEYYFIDLVFYHRILKCHVLVELKTDKVKHEHIGQLKSYLQHYKKNVQEENDNPPVGILLVTNQNKTLVEYAIADSDLDIFVSKYELQLPDKAKLEAFINNELKNTK